MCHRVDRSERNAAIVAALQAGDDPQAVAARHGVSYSVVNRVRAAAGLPRSKPGRKPTLTDDPAIAAYVAGAPVLTICADAGINISSFYHRLRRAGVPLRHETTRASRGLPVYDEAGEPFAASVVDAARKLGVLSVGNLRRRHLVLYRDGWQLASRPQTEWNTPMTATDELRRRIERAGWRNVEPRGNSHGDGPAFRADDGTQHVIIDGATDGGAQGVEISNLVPRDNGGERWQSTGRIPVRGGRVPTPDECNDLFEQWRMRQTPQ